MQAKKTTGINVDRAVMGMAGSFVLLSVVLGVIWTPWALAFTAFVGINMLQASLTGFCPAALVFHKLGIRSGCAFDYQTAAQDKQ
jgi:hypothetical protein